MRRLLEASVDDPGVDPRPATLGRDLPDAVPSGKVDHDRPGHRDRFPVEGGPGAAGDQRDPVAPRPSNERDHICRIRRCDHGARVTHEVGAVVGGLVPGRRIVPDLSADRTGQGLERSTSHGG